MRNIGIAIVFFALWLLMSGIFEPFIIGLGVASVLLTLFITGRMDAGDGDRVDLLLAPVKYTKYLAWLMLEIARANWAVTKIILARDMPIRQHLFKTPYTQKTDVGQVIFANSITLTPGTITVETEDGHFLVHAVSYSEGDPEALADMDARITACETAGGA
ncbi:Na+/H+ antiporter subunit E [Profundibacter sp.]|uniref:Na+/H+ antiporter subunit E n=1 Tax=Profundibacter sp. TaxID=3101071 RepID=UPI003D14E852